MVAGPQGAQSVLESESDRLTRGKSSKTNPTLHMPPVSAEIGERMKAWGFKFPDDYKFSHDNRGNRRSQDLVLPVFAPDGWSIRSTDHYLYKELVDNRGRVRAYMMIHVQDGDSWVQLVEAYKVTTWYKNYGDGGGEWHCIKDSSGNMVWCGDEKVTESEARSILTSRFTQKDLTADEVFDAAVEWPVWGFTPPDLLRYQLSTNYHDVISGDYRDGGSESLMASDDEDAVKIAQARFDSGRSRSSGYQRRYSLRGQKGESLWAGQDPLVRPRSRVCNFDPYYIGWDNP